ncbi:GTP cyclohydrolase, FolE2/MptA family [Staphylococcus aureus]
MKIHVLSKTNSLIAADLVEFDWLDGFDIECRNEESIHQHDAFAN